MDFKARLAEDLKGALKGGKRTHLATIRLLLAAIKTREVEKGGPLAEPEVLQVIARECNRRREALAAFQRGQRADLVAKEQAELTILESYLPRPLTGEELQVLVSEAVQATGACSRREMGKVMAYLMPRVSGRADGKVVSDLVRQALDAHD